MKLKDKLKKTGNRSKISYLVTLVAIVYTLMAGIKGVYFWTDGSGFQVTQGIHFKLEWLISKTWVYPVSSLWGLIPAIPFEDRSILELYKVIIPPAVVFLICALFISDHRSLRAKFYELKADIEKEIALREMRKDAGLDTVSEAATVDVVISNVTNNDPAWHDTWWGRVSIGVVIALIVSVFGLK